MKILKLVLVVLFLMMVSCGEDDNDFSLITDFKTSKAKWEQQKSIHGNSYTYQTTFISWTGYRTMTELTIKDGIVISRLYEAFEINGPNGQKEIIDSYFEQGTDLGSNENGANLLTIDQLYDSCISDYLTAGTKDNKLYFEAKLDGTMSTCGYVPNGCVDDCFFGVQINSIIWTN